MSSEISKNYYTIILIMSLLGGVLVLFADFAGWTEQGFYTDSYYVWIGSSNTPIYANILIFILGAGFFAITYFAYYGLQGKISDTQLRTAKMIDIGIITITVIGAVLFMIQADDALDWWFDTGFYASLIGAGVNFFFLTNLENQPAK